MLLHMSNMNFIREYIIHKESVIILMNVTSEFNHIIIKEILYVWTDTADFKLHFVRLLHVAITIQGALLFRRQVVEKKYMFLYETSSYHWCIEPTS